MQTLPKYLQEIELTQECIDLISSLPKETGWVVPYFHQYQGFWIGTLFLEGVLSFQRHFIAQDSDIFLITNPKSGTTWLKALIFALVNRDRFSGQNRENHPLLTTNPHVLVPFLDNGLYIENKFPNLDSFDSSPRLFATHLPILSLPQSVKTSGSKIVYLCRNPKDTFVSLWHFTNKMRPNDKGSNSIEVVFDKFCRGVSMFGPYWTHVLRYWKESLEKPEKVLFLKYEDIKEEPFIHLKRLAEFIGCPFKIEEEANGVIEDVLRLCSFENLSNLEVNKNGKLLSDQEHKSFFRKGEVGDWKNYLTNEMAEKLDSITEQNFFGSGLKF